MNIPHRIAYDALNPSRIPLQAEMVMGYDAWTDQDWARFTKATKVRIAQHRDHVGMQYSVLDVERWDASISEARPWILQQQQIGAPFNTIYIQESNLEELQDACLGLHYYIWLAWWTGNPRTHVPGTIGTQYAGNVAGGAYDVSAIYDSSWHPAAAA